MYTVNQPNYPDVNGLKPDFYALKLIVPGLYSGTVPIGLTGIDYSDKLTSGRLRGNSQTMLAKTSGKYEVGKCSLEMYMNDFYQGFLPFLGNLGLASTPGPLGAYEVSFGLDLVYSTPNDQFPKSVQIVGARIGEPKESHKEGEKALFVSIDLDEPFLLVRNGVIPVAVQATYWPVSTT
jgi:hypothetical protein